MATKIVEWGGKFDDGISGPAEQAAKALDSLRDSITADGAELSTLRKAMANLRGGGKAMAEDMKALKLRVDAKRQSIAQSQQEYIKLGGRLDGARNHTAKLTSAFDKFREGLRSLPGPAGQFGRMVDGIIGKLPKMRVGLVLGSLAIIGITTALAKGAKSLLTYGVAALDARRNELLLLEAHTRMRNMWGFPPGKSKDMQAAIDRIAPNVAIARGEVAGLAMQLYKAGLRGERLSTVLEASAIKQSALGGSAGSAFADFAVSIGLAGGSAARAAQDIKNRYGNVVSQQLKSLDVQALKQQENMAAMFAGVDVEPLLTAMKRLRDIFSVNTSAGRALQSMLRGIMGPLISGSTAALVALRRFFKQILIGLLELKIGLKTYYVLFIETFGGPKQKSILGDFVAAVSWGRVVVYTLAAGLLYLAGTIVLATWPFLLAATAVWGFFEIANWLYTWFTSVADWGQLGIAIIDGLVGGLKGAWNAVKSVCEGLADDLARAFKGALGIASPSKVFAQLGVEIPRGVQVGIESGKQDAADAAGSIVPPPSNAPTIAPVAQRPPGANGGARSVTLTIQNVNVSAPSGEPKPVAQAFRRELEQVLDALAAQLGAAT